MINIKSISTIFTILRGSILLTTTILAVVTFFASPVYAKETQAGSFGMEENAINMKIVLEAEGKDAVIRTKIINGKTYYRVFITDTSSANFDAPATEEPAATPEPMEQEPMESAAPEAPAPVVRAQTAKYIYIDGLGTIFNVKLRPISRLYPQPSFKSNYKSMYVEFGEINVIGKTEDGWLVVRAQGGGANFFVPVDDWKLESIGKKKRKLSASE
jgi:hypothetical protein